MKQVVDRFLHYVSYDTQSDSGSTTSPSTEKQKVLGAELERELRELGLEGVHLDPYGIVYGWLPATPGCEDAPCIGLNAHMDTSPDAPGAHIKPRIVHYEGGDIVLNQELGVVMRAAEHESLARNIGKHLVVTDGTTLLGADDKAGLAEIMAALEYLTGHPEIRHGRVAVAFTPDEEVGRGTEHFDVAAFGAAGAYTLDGVGMAGMTYDNFNGAKSVVTVTGFNIHPGDAKDKMKNASLIAHEFLSLLPEAETPAHTAGREGYYHLQNIRGNESGAVMQFIIREHDKEKFAFRKAYLQKCAELLDLRYGPGTVKVETTDTYYNMKEIVEQHMDLVYRARSAMERAGVTPVEFPIRGGTDGAWLTYMGLPCPNLSCGMENTHSIYEYVPVEDMEKMVQVLVNLVSAQ